MISYSRLICTLRDRNDSGKDQQRKREMAKERERGGGGREAKGGWESVRDETTDGRSKHA